MTKKQNVCKIDFNLSLIKSNSLCTELFRTITSQVNKLINEKPNEKKWSLHNLNFEET